MVRITIKGNLHQIKNKQLIGSKAKYYKCSQANKQNNIKQRHVGHEKLLPFFPNNTQKKRGVCSQFFKVKFTIYLNVNKVLKIDHVNIPRIFSILMK